MSLARYDFDLHGVVGVRLLDATPGDLATVTRQLGLPTTELDRDPDITIRFVEVATNRPLTFVGLGDTGFNRDGFFVFRGRGRRAGLTRFPFDTLGQSPELVCERTVPAVPHLLATINLVALTKGVLPLHASAFTIDSLGVLVTGWSKGGKTEALLAGMERGASYVGDEWVYLTPDGTMLGLPEPIRVWDWHLAQFESLKHARSRPERVRLAIWRALSAAAGMAESSSVPGNGLAGKLHPVASRQAYLQVPPVELFAPDRVTLRGRLDAAVLMFSHTSSDITIESAGPTELPDRMAASLAEERATFLAHYRQFRFAFPDLSSPVLESAEVRESHLLAALFGWRPCVKVSHPHPCDIRALGDAVLSAAQQIAGGVSSDPLAAS